MQFHAHNSEFGKRVRFVAGFRLEQGQSTLRSSAQLQYFVLTSNSTVLAQASLDLDRRDRLGKAASHIRAILKNAGRFEGWNACIVAVV